MVFHVDFGRSVFGERVAYALLSGSRPVVAAGVFNRHHIVAVHIISVHGSVFPDQRNGGRARPYGSFSVGRPARTVPRFPIAAGYFTPGYANTLITGLIESHVIITVECRDIEIGSDRIIAEPFLAESRERFVGLIFPRFAQVGGSFAGHLSRTVHLRVVNAIEFGEISSHFLFSAPSPFDELFIRLTPRPVLRVIDIDIGGFQRKHIFARSYGLAARQHIVVLTFGVRNRIGNDRIAGQRRVVIGIPTVQLEDHFASTSPTFPTDRLLHIASRQIQHEMHV